MLNWMRVGTLALVVTAASITWAQPEPLLGSVWNVMDFGAVADGETDNTEAFQKAMDAAWEAGGGIVWVPTGRYN